MPRRPQTAEQHLDDRGSDFSVLLVLGGRACDGECRGPRLGEWGACDEQPLLVIPACFGMTGPEVAMDFCAEQSKRFDGIAGVMGTARPYFVGKQFECVVGLCGGLAGTAVLLIGRGYRGGPNFDVVCGCDLVTDAS